MPEPDPTVEEGSGVNKREQWADHAVAEEPTAVFSVRVPISIIARYRRLPRRRRRYVREAVEEYVAQMVGAAERLDPEAPGVVFVRPSVTVSVPTMMVRVEDTNDAELLRERLRQLEGELRVLRKVAANYKEKYEAEAAARRAAEARAAQLERAARELESSLRSSRATLDRIVSAVRAWARGELSSEEALRRVADEFYIPELFARGPPSLRSPPYSS